MVRFLHDRFADEVGLILQNTPVFGVDGPPDFEAQFLDRGGLLGNLGTKRAITSLITEAMHVEQGDPPAGPQSFQAGPITLLGVEILQLLAAQYAGHHDYREEWRPSVQLPPHW